MIKAVVAIPTRGRPGNIAKVVRAWRKTRAFQGTDMLLGIDQDDPEYRNYVDLVMKVNEPGFDFITFESWRPMVTKLNVMANYLAETDLFIGFAGDDHIPRINHSSGCWSDLYQAKLTDMGTGIVYGNDLHRQGTLCTEWMMTADIIRALGRMVPAPVDHLFSDRSVMELGKQAGCIQYLPNVVIEHMHYQAGKANKDATYQLFNTKENFLREQKIYWEWMQHLLPEQSAMVRALRPERDTKWG